MIVALLIASLAVVLRMIRQAGWKRTRQTRTHHAGCITRARLLVRSGTTLPRGRRLRWLERPDALVSTRWPRCLPSRGRSRDAAQKADSGFTSSESGKHNDERNYLS